MFMNRGRFPRGRRPVVVLAVCFIVCGLLWNRSPAPAYACTCVEPPPPETALEQSHAVFAGEVLSIRKTRSAAGLRQGAAYPVEVTFRVIEIWKGVDTDRLTIRTSASSESCGFEFVTGVRYIVYANENRDGLSTGACTRTADLAHAAEDLQALGKGTAPPPSPELEERMRSNPLAMPMFWFGTAFAVVSAALLVFLLLRLRRRQ